MSSFKALSRIAAIGVAVAVGLLAMAQKPAVAQTNGSWITTGGGSWPTTGNWNGGSVADGTGASGTFAKDVPASTTYTITLDGNRTIGNLTFTDVTASSNSVWSITAGSGGSLTLAVSSGAPTITTSTNSVGSIAANIAGTQGVTKAANGLLFVSGSNSYTGITQVNAGTLEVMSTDALGATGAGNHTVVASPGRVRIGADVTTYEDFSIAGVGNAGAINFGSSQSGTTVSTATIAGQVTLTANARMDTATSCVGTFDRLGQGGHSIQLSTFTGTFSGAGTTQVKSPIVGTGQIAHNGTGRVIFTAANTYSGSTRIMGNGSLELGDGGTSGSLSTSSPIFLNTLLATFVVNQSDTVEQGVDFSGSAITVSGGANIGNFTQAGSGTTILNAANAYTGATNVTAGKLLINGNQSGATGAVTVAAGATLGGSGTTGGAVTVNGTLSPGNSPGVLTASSVVLGSTSTSFFEINNTSRGTGYDGVDITTASGLTYDGALSLSFGNGSAFANSTTFDLFSFTGTPSGNFSSVTSTGFYAGTWTLASGLWSLTTSEQKLTFTPSTGDIVVAVPEPSTIVLLSGLAVAGFFARRRRAA